MPKTSRDSAGQVRDFGAGEDRSERLGDYTVTFMSIRTDFDLAPVLAGLPGGQCQCPHWGYVLRGSITITYGDRKETIGAGGAFYLPPGHTPAATEGTEFVQFSPTDKLAELEAALTSAMPGQGA